MYKCMGLLSPIYSAAWGLMSDMTRPKQMWKYRCDFPVQGIMIEQWKHKVWCKDEGDFSIQNKTSQSTMKTLQSIYPRICNIFDKPTCGLGRKNKRNTKKWKTNARMCCEKQKYKKHQKSSFFKKTDELEENNLETKMNSMRSHTILFFWAKWLVQDLVL